MAQCVADGPRGRTRSRKPGFGDRAGTGAALTPFGQPYVIVARKIKDGDPATAVITESGSALPEKLPGIGVENEANAVTGLKRDIAAQTNQNYQTVTGLIPAGTRTAQGTGGAFTKDLTAYFTAGFTQAAPVAFVNFKDLDPNGGPTPVEADQIRRKVYSGCTYATRQCTRYSNGSYGLCESVPNQQQWQRGVCPYSIDAYGNVPPLDRPIKAAGDHFEWAGPVSTCGGAIMTPIPAGGMLTNGWITQWGFDRNGGGGSNGYCAQSVPGYECRDSRVIGNINMNNITWAADTCETRTWPVAGMAAPQVQYGSQYSQLGVCCSYRWEPDYPVSTP